MAPAPQFQLFPPAQPLNRPNGNPFRKDHRRRRSAKSPSVSPSLSPVVEGIKLGKTETVILQIIEDANTITPPRTVSVDGDESPTVVETTNQLSDSSVSPSESKKTASSPPQQPVEPSLVCTTSGSLQTPSSPSPIVPMRSIFPRYDPTVPLNQQHYFPQHPTAHDLPREVVSRAEYLPNVTSPVGDPQVAPLGSQFASAKELARLWEATKGEEPQTGLGAFYMRVTRIGPTTFTIGNHPVRLYTLSANLMDFLEISKSHPCKPNLNFPIVTLNPEQCYRDRSSDGWGFATILFPKLAEMLARDQAAELAARHMLAPTDAMDVEEDAVRRAASQESCFLEWNEAEHRYDVHHSGLITNREASSPNDRSAENSGIQNDEPGVLHITISKSTSSRALRQPPTLLLTVPDTSDTRSTNSNHMNDTPLVAFDLDSMTLSVSAGLICSTIVSLYAIDTLTTAILTVALSDPTTKAAFADMEIQAPHTEDFPKPSASAASTSKFHSANLFATQAEREDAEQEAVLMSQIKSSKSKSKSKLKKDGAKTKLKPMVIEEIDLESYGRYGSSSSREGEKLPGITRAGLKAMFWGFRLVVWTLSFVVKSVAWVLVRSTRYLTSERF